MPWQSLKQLRDVSMCDLTPLVTNICVDNHPAALLIRQHLHCPLSIIKIIFQEFDSIYAVKPPLLIANDATLGPSNSNNLKLLNEFRECITVLVLIIITCPYSTTLNIGHYNILDHYEALCLVQRKPTLALNALTTVFVRNEEVVAVRAVSPTPYNSIYHVITHALEIGGDLPEEYKIF